jgi:hypothetical protein
MLTEVFHSGWRKNLSYSAQKLLAFVLLALVDRASASPLFEDDAVLAINLIGPISTLIEEKKNSTELPFVLRADDVEHLIKVRVRGNSRTRVCDTPPARLNFVKSKTKNTVFAGQDKIKLVTHCHDSDPAQANILQEYAAYKMFSVISDVGYKVRLAQISYRDTERRLKRDSFVRYGILIESASELSDRVGGKRVHIPGVTLGSLDKLQAAKVYVFNYMIGNTDWSLVAAEGSDECCHNNHLFDIDSQRFMVPYDFDLSGLVNARYARPDSSLGIRRVTSRLYRGYCIPPEVLKDAISAIAERRDDILGVVRRVPSLFENDIKAMEEYLHEFFDQANDVDKLVKSFERRCL